MKKLFFRVLFVGAFFVSPMMHFDSLGAMWSWFSAEPEFNEQQLDDFLEQQNYQQINPIISYNLEVKQHAPAIDWVKNGFETRKDPYCFYTYIRNGVLIKRDHRGALSTFYVSEILTDMFLSLGLIAGDVMCCIAKGYDPQKTIAVYSIFRNHYYHWYKTHFCKDNVKFEAVYNAACEWLRSHAEVQGQPPVWIKFCTWSFRPRHWLIYFNNPEDQEYRSCFLTDSKHQIATYRGKSIDEYMDKLHQVKTWENFFHLGLDILNNGVLQGLASKFKITLKAEAQDNASEDVDDEKDEDPKDAKQVNQATQGVSDLSLSGVSAVGPVADGQENGHEKEKEKENEKGKENEKQKQSEENMP